MRNKLSYKSGQIFLPFCHNRRVWRTDRRTDGQTDRILITIPRLHYMQRSKNRLRLAEVIVKNKMSRFFMVQSVAQSCYSVIGDKPFLWSEAKFHPP